MMFRALYYITLIYFGTLTSSYAETWPVVQRTGIICVLSNITNYDVSQGFPFIIDVDACPHERTQGEIILSQLTNGSPNLPVANNLGYDSLISLSEFEFNCLLVNVDFYATKFFELETETVELNLSFC